MSVTASTFELGQTVREKTTWNDELAREMQNRGESGADLVAKAPLDDEVWKESFNPGYGGSEGKPVLAWSNDYVYFPAVYDGAEWIDSAPRNPGLFGQEHVGGQ